VTRGIRMTVRCGLGLALASLASSVPSVARADDAGATYFHPHDPIAFTSLSFGAGAFGAGAPATGDKQSHGYGGVGNVAARLDLEALSPLWLSVAGRSFVGTPAEAELDASIGYELRGVETHPVAGGDATYDRWSLRPLVGFKAVRFADSPAVPTAETITAIRAGLDCVLLDSGTGIRGFNVWRAHLVGLWDPSRAGPGIEFETTAGISGKRVLAGGFVGASVGYLPSTGGYGFLELGAAWEVGR
jgi:hypothetical protein